MYQGYFGLESAPFSIVPDHRVVYMSVSHKEAVAHLLYSLKQSGGFVQLTGEVGTGKTTVCRYLLQHLPEDVDVALLLNPRINEQEMLEAICDELGVAYPAGSTLKILINTLNIYLLNSHSKGRHTVLIIDEAQNLSREVLEQVRLLTNLETSTEKLLQIILIGQPELESVLGRHDLRQLSQRIIGRFRLEPLNLRETREYIRFRMAQAGCERRVFTGPAIRRVHRLSDGVPRLINVLCDAALMGAFSEDRDKVTWGVVGKVAPGILPPRPRKRRFGGLLRWALIPILLGILVLGAMRWDIPARLSALATAIENSEGNLPTLPGSSTDSDDVDAPTDQAMAPDPGITLVQRDVKPTPATGNGGEMTGQESDDRATDSRFDLIYRLGVPLQQP